MKLHPVLPGITQSTIWSLGNIEYLGTKYGAIKYHVVRTYPASWRVSGVILVCVCTIHTYTFWLQSIFSCNTHTMYVTSSTQRHRTYTCFTLIYYYNKQYIYQGCVFPHQKPNHFRETAFSGFFHEKVSPLFPLCRKKKHMFWRGTHWLSSPGGPCDAYATVKAHCVVSKAPRLNSSIPPYLQ